MYVGKTMSVFEMEFNDGYFDGVLDKGTMDSILVSMPEDGCLMYVVW
jgi:hypothetical protein